jgi:hypothetical protein
MQARTRWSRTAPRGLGLLCFLALGACEADLPHLPKEPVPDALSVNFLLQRGGPPPEISDGTGTQAPPGRIYGFVGRASDPAEVYLKYVFDAAASVNGTPLSVRRRPGAEFYDGTSRPLESEYNYFTDALTLQPGALYTLRVDQGGQHLEASTRLPGEFNLVEVNGSSRGRALARGQPLTLRWTRAAGAAVYAVSVESPPGGPDLGVVPRLPYLTSDTSAILPFTYAGTGTVPVTVEIRAMDPNLYRASTHHDARAGIAGGFGFFGSANVKRYRFDLLVNQ